MIFSKAERLPHETPDVRKASKRSRQLLDFGDAIVDLGSGGDEEGGRGLFDLASSDTSCSVRLLPMWAVAD
ncbi:MAG: hypothetical protein ACI9DF_003395 [Verrucomicrobiales bacterium]|jgi:hypothetical protein